MKAEEFEAEMNQSCPVHGVRRLGRILHVSAVVPRSVEQEDTSQYYPEGEMVCIMRDDAELELVLQRYYAALDAAEEDPSSSDV